MIGNYHPYRLVQMIKSVETKWSALHSAARAECQRQKLRTDDDFAQVFSEMVKKEYQFLAPGEHNWRADEFEDLQPAYKMFDVCGKAIFNVSALAPLFEHTDVGGIVFADLEIGRLGSYFHFGQSTGLYLNDDRSIWVDGAYAIHAKSNEGAGFSGGFLFFVCNNQFWQNPNATIAEMLVDVSRLAKMGMPGDQTIKEVLASGEMIGGDPLLKNNIKVLTRGLSLVVNSIMYMNSVDPDIEEGYDDDAPPSLVRKASKVSTKAIRELDRAGYSRVKFFGRSIARTYLNGKPGDDGAHSKETHWRRGHWRRARVGEGRGNIQIVWVRPTIVNKEAGTPQKLTIYDVEPKAPDRNPKTV